MSNTLSKEEKDNSQEYRANFLWGFEDDSIEVLGYEFANGKTEAYLKEVWEQLVQLIAQQEAIGFKNWYEKSGYAKLLREQPFQSLIPIPPDEELYNLYLKYKEKQQ